MERGFSILSFTSAAALAVCVGLSAGVAIAAGSKGGESAAPRGVAIDPIMGGRTVSLAAAKLPRWGAVRGAHRSQTGSKEWKAMLGKIGNASGQALIRRVNSVVNGVRYVADRSDTWRAPSDFFRKGGDCEDYAIAKYMLLKAKGVPASSMRILMIPATASEPGHSVLVVNSSGGPLVLDNRRAGVYRLPRGMASRATYSFNDSTWWVNVDGGRRLAGR